MPLEHLELHAAVGHAPHLGPDLVSGAMRHANTYTIDFQYSGPGRCTMKCYHQAKQSDGRFVPGPCPHVKVLQ